MAASSPSYQPSLPWRLSSSFTMGLVASLSRSLMFTLYNTEVHGLDQFLDLLDERKDIEGRQRGLVTVSNHVSIVDDPFIWGALPFKYAFIPDNHRWSLGSYDLCFKNKATSTLFTLGQVLPTHRAKYSIYGGPFQPTMTQVVRLLSDPKSCLKNNGDGRLDSPVTKPRYSFFTPDIMDPFSSTECTYSTDGQDLFPAPSVYPSRKHAWIHVFPEGRVHQHPHKTMRYFRWGVARMILEPEQCPDIVPIWIEGPDQIFHEERKFPRFLPRIGKRVGIWFGDNVGGDRNDVFLELRRRWQKLVEQDRRKRGALSSDEVGVLSEELKYGQDAVNLRKECTIEVRNEVLRLRRKRGLPDEDPKQGLVETWIEEGCMDEGRKKDGSVIKDA